jgi:hypothetical protein
MKRLIAITTGQTACAGLRGYRTITDRQPTDLEDAKRNLATFLGALQIFRPLLDAGLLDDKVYCRLINGSC